MTAGLPFARRPTTKLLPFGPSSIVASLVSPDEVTVLIAADPVGPTVISRGLPSSVRLPTAIRLVVAGTSTFHAETNEGGPVLRLPVDGVVTPPVPPPPAPGSLY